MAHEECPKLIFTICGSSTVNVVTIDAAVCRVVAACVAVIVAEPPPTSVTRPVVELIDATAVFDDAYVKAPVLVDDGGATVNAASPKVFVGIVKFPRLGTPRPTVSTT
jgi:hypothetical protein